jgi:hypothetical protein
LIDMRTSAFCRLTAVLYCIALAAQTNPAQSVLIEDAGFVPSGWMGDAEKDAGAFKVNESSSKRPGSPLPHSEQWTYRPKPGGQWAGVAWQFPEKNWGDKPGKDWSKRGFSKVSFWARGVRDKSGIVPKCHFGAGERTKEGKRYQYQSSFEEVWLDPDTEFVTLSEDWKEYTIGLKGRNLSQVIVAFVFTIRAKDVGPDGATFFLDNITYE